MKPSFTELASWFTVGYINQTFMHGIGDKVAVADVHEVFEIPADSSVADIHQSDQVTTAYITSTSDGCS